MHLTALITLFSAIAMLLGTVTALTSSLLFIFGALTLFCMRRYFDVCFHMQPYEHFFTWCKMKYITNLMFTIGGLKRSFKFKTFCIEPSF
jgi:hypothetical protein